MYDTRPLADKHPYHYIVYSTVHQHTKYSVIYFETAKKWKHFVNSANTVRGSICVEVNTLLFQSLLLLRTEIRLSNLHLLQSRYIEALHMLSPTLYIRAQVCTLHRIVSSTCAIYARLGWFSLTSLCIPYSTIVYDDCHEISTRHTDDSLTVLKLTKFLNILKGTSSLFAIFNVSSNSYFSNTRWYNYFRINQ